MIHELVILSGKGGTGKTSIAASLAVLANNAVIADCDVDAANLHILLQPEIKEKHEFSSSRKAFINKGMCLACGKCILECRFDAVDDYYVIDNLSCEGCGVCAAICPYDAIEMKDHISGEWFVSQTKWGPFVHAKLGIAEGNSGKLVTLIKKTAKEIASEKGHELVIVDGSPGTGCPVISTLSGASSVLIVTEPTVSGLHDLKRLYEVAKRFNIKTSLCLNKVDINKEKSQEIIDYCSAQGIDLVGEVPYDEDFTRAMVAGTPVICYSDGDSSQAIKKMWQKLSQSITIKENTHAKR